MAGESSYDARRSLAGWPRLIAEVAVVLVLAIALGLTLSSAAVAHDGSDTTKYGIKDRNDKFIPNDGDQAFNGFKVFLSSPRHRGSGSKGECRNPGREENVNGRKFNWEAANGGYYKLEWKGHKYPLANVHGRGYKVLVSKNLRDNGAQANIDKSNAWGADIHIVTHTNGTTGCDTDSNFLLTGWWDYERDRDLARELGPTLNDGYANVKDGVIGPGKRTRVDDKTYWSIIPGEARYTAAPEGTVYVELQFHDNQWSQRWIHDESNRRAAYLYGLAIDFHLVYP